MHARAVLEFEEVVKSLAIFCETSQGRANCVDLAPAFDADTVWELLSTTAEAHQMLAQQAPPSLGAVRDIHQPLMRAQKGGSLGGQELFQVAESLRAMRGMRSFLETKKSEGRRLWAYAEALPDFPATEKRIFEALEPNGDVKDSASAELSALRRRKGKAMSRLQERVQAYTTGKTREMLSDPIVTVRDGRYVVPLKAEYRGRIRGIVHDTSGSGQTIFVEPEDVLQLGNEIREIEAAEREEVARVLRELSGEVGKVAPVAAAGLVAVGEIDLAFAKGRYAYDIKGSMPERLQSPRIEIEGGRHPMLDRDAAVPLNLSVGLADNVLITGPNTGGKTVAIKTVGLFVLMAQSGLFPCALNVRIGVFSQVWADIGDEQSLQQSLSTFSGHIKNIADAIKGVREGALVLLDEIGAGTDPAEGAALARAILSEFADRGAAVLASTHYGELKAFAFDTVGYRNAAMEFNTKTFRPTYRLLADTAGSSHALKIAERHGIPSAVIAKAQEGLSEQHREMSRVFEGLDTAQKQARIAQAEADRRISEVQKLEDLAHKKLAEADEVRRTAFRSAEQAIDEELRAIRERANAVFDELKRSGGSQKGREEARDRLKDVARAGEEVAKRLSPSRRAPLDVDAIQKGMNVLVDGYAQAGTVVSDPADGSVVVQIGPIRITVPAAKVRQTKGLPDTKRPRTNIRLERAQTAVTEIHLRAMRAEDAVRDLERFIDDAVLAGIPSVRIVHGKGGGILRDVTREFLRKNVSVASFRDGEAGEGGHGVTIAVIK